MDTTSTARGRTNAEPYVRQARVYAFDSSAFIGDPWPKNAVWNGTRFDSGSYRLYVQRCGYSKLTALRAQVVDRQPPSGPQHARITGETCA